MTTNKTFFETKIIQILDEFNDLSFRVNIEKLIIFYIIQYFKLSNILEIGLGNIERNHAIFGFVLST